ncbi:alpha/beta-Hydrolases superfamily protein [Striga asiatica]|uniref:Alpha/beta-Hydrolases superfamily protein n=1 Tax=Striga asiatica TaxID=4170 RepID=A0A5A7REK2_STRAF|nr:alpha/beta-Hydrolases superfamily protein [Striga asiatica]
MSEVNGSSGWRGEFMDDEEVVGKANNGYSYSPPLDAVGGRAAAADWRFQAAEFAKGAAEMSVEFGKGVRDVVRQSILRDDSVIVRKFKGPCVKILGKLRFLNEYLPEDRDPAQAWAVIASVWILVLAEKANFAVLIVNISQPVTNPLVRKMKVHPTSASLILLPDGRRLAYQEQGVSPEQARYSIVVPHSFLSSRLAGIPGLKDTLLQSFGVRFVTYDLPGFGESDAHPHRDLESSALDMLHLSYAVNITDKFWVLGYAEGSKHAWAALHYIPDRIAGAIMFAPMVNPYEPRLTKEERRRIWGTWTVKRKLMYFLARKFHRLLPYFYRRSFLSGNHGPDRAIVETRIFKDFWERDVEESVRQANVKPFVEEAILQISNWGFSLAELNMQSKKKGSSILGWLKSVYSPSEKQLGGLLGPIHIWQGAEDRFVPPSMSDFVQRVLPDVMLHKLPYEGHFTYFYFCDECHRQIFGVVFGNPQGPLVPMVGPTPLEVNDESEEKAEVIVSSECECDAAKEEENVSTCSMISM